MMKRALFLAVVFLSGACSGDQRDACADNDDCFANEVCRPDGFCGTPLPGGADGGADAGGGDTASPNGDEDATRDVSMADGGEFGDDVGREDEDAATSDARDATDSDSPDDVCIADPFVQCVDDEDPDNNSFPGEDIGETTRGCQPQGFMPLDTTISGRMCALDPEDLYRFTLVECDEDEPGFVIEATLDVKEDCDPDLIHFDVEGIGTTCADPDPDDDQTIRCETLADGSRRISILWPGQSNPVVGGIRFSIQTPDRMDVQFDYDLHLVLREP